MVSWLSSVNLHHGRTDFRVGILQVRYENPKNTVWSRAGLGDLKECGHLVTYRRTMPEQTQ